jgi:hypothetical protein
MEKTSYAIFGMKKQLVLLCLFITCFTNAQSNTNAVEISETTKVELGAELQLYPAGIMSMLTSNVFLNEKWALRFRVGGNFADRQDFSDYNDDEVASGFGATIGVVRYFPYGKGNFILGASIDTWNMWTDWKDDLDTANPTQGETYNLVIQPWINGGYLFDLSEKWNAGGSLGFGREINVITRGENVGEGWMGIVTLSVNYKIK